MELTECGSIEEHSLERVEDEFEGASEESRDGEAREDEDVMRRGGDDVRVVGWVKIR
jgi:hypothetical protein